MQALGIQLPKLPELDKDDLKAVRSFLPGKLLSRTAALLALGVLATGFAVGLHNELLLLGLNLSPNPGLHLGLIFGLPSLAIASQLFVEWRAQRARRALQRLAVQPGIEQTGYFRVGPYLNTAEDRTKFDRADHAHEKVLNWIERSSSLPLYLTGDSGCGKSSLLNAFVLPTLRDHGWTIVDARAWQDPEVAIRDALIRVGGTRRARQAEIRDLLAAGARVAEKRLLVVLDQFEEFLIFGKPEIQEKFNHFIANLKADPIQRLNFLFVLRSDYQTLLDDLGMPPLRHGENFYQVGRFTLAAATGFMARSGLKLHPDTLDRLLFSASEVDETPGLVRPITMNVVGYVLATGRAVAMSADAGQLVRQYIEVTCGQPAIRDFAFRVLEQLITEQGTKQPRSERDLAIATNLRHAEVRAVLNGLGEAALARPLDPENGVWELSHDFIARAVSRYLGRQRRKVLRRSVSYVAPALLLATLLITAGVFAWERFSIYESRTKLMDLGLTARSGDNGLIIEHNDYFAAEKLKVAGPILAKLQLQSIDLSDTDIDNLEPLKGLTALQELYLGGTEVASLEPLKGLTALQRLGLNGDTQVVSLEPLKSLPALRELYLTGTRVDNLEPLKGLTTLQRLDLNGNTQLVSLEPLKSLTALQRLDLSRTRVNNLEPLKSLTALQWLDLNGTRVDNLELLKGLTALQELYLGGTEVASLELLKDLTALRRLGLNGNTQVVSLEPLKSLPALRELYLTGTRVDNLEPLKGLTALQRLDLNGTHVDNIEPLKGITALQRLNLSRTRVDNLEPLKGLTALQWLDLNGTQVVSLEPLKGLTALQELYLGGTRVASLEPLKGLTALQQLNLSRTRVDNLEPLKGLTALQRLDINGTRVDNLVPLKGLTVLQRLDLKGTRVDNLVPLKGLTALQRLDLSRTRVDNLEPLKGLTVLQRLDINGTQIVSLEPLKGLTALQELYRFNTNVSLEPLKGLAGLRIVPRN